MRQNELYLPSIPLDGHLFSDVGFRYRKNEFDIEDDWYEIEKTPNANFTDYVFYNADIFEVDPEDADNYIL